MRVEMYASGTVETLAAPNGTSAIADYVRRQLASGCDGNPFASGPAIAGSGSEDAPDTAVRDLDPELNASLFATGSASVLHRLSLVSAAIKQTAALHRNQTEGCLVWTLPTDHLLNVAAGTRHQSGTTVIPARWQDPGLDDDAPVKQLFGRELAQWRDICAVIEAASAEELAAIELPPLPVLVAYSEAAAPVLAGYPASFPVMIGLHVTPERSRLEVRFAAGTAWPGASARLLDRLLTVLAAMLRAPGEPLRSIAIVGAAERAFLLRGLNDTAAPCPDAVLPALIEAQVRRTPRARAVTFGAEEIDYAELNARANRLARRLRAAAGVGPDALVAVCMERSIELVVALLAVLKAGGAYVPLDPRLPPERLAGMLDDAAPAALVTHRAVDAGVRAALCAQARGAGAAVLDLDADAMRRADLPDTDLDAAETGLTPAHAAYVIYTSGSTGRPKGVVNEHRGIVNRLVWMQKAYRLGDDDAVLQKTPFGFDVSVWEFFWPLMVGARLVVARPEGHKDPAYLAALIDAERITTLHFVPSMLAIFLEQAPEGSCRGLRRVFCSGEALPARSVHRFLERFAPAELHNLYGPTEAAVDVTAWNCSQGPRGTVVPIGRPIDNIRIYILDEHGQPTPLGVAGELHIAGIGVARGYLNRPDLTAQRFLPDPFDPRPGQRMYRTGDLARYLPDGQIEYLGRNDSQIKLRGFRIELGEIEAVLAACPGVRDAAVAARADTAGEPRLVAYLVRGDADADLSAATLRARLARRLPDYMQPAAYLEIDALPLSVNGKLDRNALPDPLVPPQTQPHEPPQGPVEEQLANLWREALGVPAIGRHDHFFELGGHSLRAVRMLAKVERAFGRAVPLPAFFGADTIAALARLLETGDRADGEARPAGASGRRPPVSLTRDRPLPASMAQRRLWFLGQLEPGAQRAYHIPVAVRIAGILDRAALREALDAAVGRHEALRTRFTSIDGVPHQIIDPADTRFPLREEDLGGLRQEARAHRLGEHVAAEQAAGFDLLAELPIRGRLLRLDDEEHVLLLTLHHIATDGWSLQILAREVSAIYAAIVEGRAVRMPPLDLQYADLARWQDEAADGQALAYWLAELQGAPALLELPTDRPRPPVQSHRGALVPLVLTPELVAGLRQLGREHGCTMFMVLLTAWAALLSRLSGQDEVVIGTPVANRDGAGMNDVIGLFVNTLALRIRPADAASMTDLMRQARQKTLAAFEHQHAPFDSIVEALRPSRSLAHGPIFQTMLALDIEMDGESLDLTGLRVEPLPLSQVTAQFDLSLAAVDRGSQIDACIEFATDLFDRRTVEAWGTLFLTVLEAMAATPQCPPDRLPLLAAPQQRRLLREMSGEEIAFEGPPLIHAHFERQARLRPDADAVVSGEQSLTYGQLDARADALARILADRGVAAGQRVAICVERSLDLIVGLLAILKAGGAYVPLDPDYPDERLRFMLGDCGPCILLTRASLAARLAGLAGKALPTLVFEELPNGADGAAPADGAGSALPGTAIAYVIYTSGSTGQPKGVMVEHASVVNHMHVHARLCGLRSGDRLLQFASCSFDTSVEEIFPALAVGATIVLRPAELMTPDETFVRFLTEHAIDIVDLPTAFWHLWAREVGQGRSLPGPRLRLVVVGGEKLVRGYLDQWLSAPGGVTCPVLNTYGPTEATIYATALECRPGSDLGDDVPIGRPIPNTRIYVLDRAGMPVPPGVAGEIYIAGAGVARGYLGRPELTAERFLPDPWSDRPNARMYRTGDLGRWRHDGTLQYLGRNDLQVKIRGYRVEPGEIEACLAACPDVREAVVAAHEDPRGDTRLVAYVVGRAGFEDAALLRDWLSRHLPAHMVPGAYVFLPALPLTGSGKLDRKALPAPVEAARHARAAHEPPVGDVELQLAAIWEELLQVTQVGRRDSFFELGGHSLLALELLSRVRTRLGKEIGLKQLFEHPALSDLAAVLTDAPGVRPIIARPDCSAPAPLTFAQSRLWFLAQIPGESEAYHIPMAVGLEGDLDVPALRRALDRIYERHDVLRTRIAPGAEEATQVARPSGGGFPLVARDLRDGGEALDAALAEAANAPFDLIEGPLIRAHLFRTGDRAHTLAITVHHLIADAWSTRILVDELARLYQTYHVGQPDPLPDPRLQYADYAIWQRQSIDGDQLDQQRRHWRNVLQDAPPLLALPLDRPRPDRQDHAGALMPVEIGTALTRRLRDLARRRGTTLFTVVLAGWSAVLSRLAGEQDLVIGSPVANRTRPDVERMMGLFANTLALRVRVEGSFADLLDHAKQVVEAAQTHQDLPFEQVLDIVKPPRTLAHSPVFQVMLNWQAEPAPELRLPGLEIRELDLPYTVAKFDLELVVDERDDELVAQLRFATALFDPQTMRRHAGYLRRMLEAMVADQQQPVRAVDILDKAERDWLLDQPVETGLPVPAVHVHRAFEQQVALAPGATAVSFAGRHLSYEELNGAANRLARYLRQIGAGPEDRVAICLERGLDMVVAILAVLKSGAAYVPFDPGYPADRLTFMLEDAAPSAILTARGSREWLDEAASATTIVDMQADRHLWAELDDRDLPQASGSRGAADLAYIIYTSGSTGTPKGAMIEHANVTRLFSATHHWFRFDAGDVWTLFHSIAFDFSVWEVFGALLHGGRLVVVPQSVTRSPADFHRLVCDERVTVLNQTPSAFNQLMAADAVSASRHALKWVIFGGEALEPRNLVPWVGRHGDACPRMVNMYGITETTVHVTFRPLRREDVERDGNASPIGKPIPDLQLYVLDPERRPAPIGVTGELYVGGAGVARGYLNRAELTAERFVAHPFAPGARLYRTGDLGRVLADGEIEYLGRNDHQVKIRGYRIELGEIEARLGACAGVRDAVVLVREDHAGERRLVAWVVGQPGATLSPGALKAELAKHLADFMVPTAIVVLPELPLTVNGKLDRAALPAPARDAAVSDRFEPPVGPLEEALAEALAEVLGLDRVGRHDNFFALGGHSLLALKLIERLRGIGHAADVQTLFAAPTVAGLAAGGAIEVARSTVPPNLIPADAARITPDMLTLVDLDQAQIDSIAAAVTGGAANIQDIYPLAPLQEGFLFHHLMEQRGDAYLTSTIYHARSREHVRAYAEAVQRVIDRHDILRTSLAWEGLSEPVQVVWRRAALRVDDVSLDPADGDVTAQLLEQFDPSNYRIDLRKAPLWRIVVAHDAPNRRWVMLELIHHLIDDRTTMQFLEEEVRSLLQDPARELPPVTPFREFVARTRTTAERNAHEAYFRDLLAEVDTPTAPYGVVDVAAEGGRIKEATRALPAALGRGLRETARSQGVSVATICHLAWAILLSRLCDRDDVVFGTVMSGRMRDTADAGRSLGVFINTLPVRMQLAGRSIRDCLSGMHRQLTALIAHEHAPLALAQRCSGVQPPLPLFTSLLNYRHVDPAAGSGVGLERTGEEFGLQFVGARERSNYPFNISFNDPGDTAFSIDLQAIDSVDAEELTTMLTTTLESLVEWLRSDPEAGVDRVEILDAAQTRRLSIDWAGPVRAPTDGQLVQHLFERQAVATPDAEAVRDRCGTLTYAELNAAANRLAHRLLGLGVKPDDRIGICVARGIRMSVALLAVLKAGGAFVPLDPELPSARLSYLLADAGPVALLTEKELLACPAADALRSAEIPVLLLDDLAIANDCGEDAPGNPQIPELTPANLAYVLYTSGSTGAPKGVMVHHGGLSHYLAYAVGAYLPPQVRGGVVATPFSFDATLTTLLAPWLVGKATLLLSDDRQQSLHELLDLCSGPEPWLFKLTPSHLEALSDLSNGMASVTPHVIVVGGEQLTWHTLDRFRRRVAARALVVNEYGPTETVVGCTTHVVGPADAPGVGAVPIGRPIANTRIHLLDRRGRPVPAGIPGEIHIAGDGVARGYLNRPQLTAERFVADSFAREAAQRMYRTGDLARWLPDGSLLYLGRNDLQIKLRGYRIEPGEIEAALLAIDGVREAAVVARDSGTAQAHLVAFVVAEPGRTIEPDDVRAPLARRLAAYMLPRRICVLDAMPLTRNGKLAREALPVPSPDDETGASFSPPRDEIETSLAAIWSVLLGRGTVGRDDDFFDLGGHSLLAVRLMSRIREELGVEVPIRQIFETPVLKDLAERLRSRDAQGGSNLVAIRAGGVRLPLFLVHPGEGEVGYARALAARLDPALPVYALAASGFLAGETAADRVEDMAATYIACIRSVQPQGPYRIAGWSLGGTIAYEMARQLLEAGERVTFLGLFDTRPVYDALEAGAPARSGRAREVEYVLARLAGRASPSTAAVLRMYASENDLAAMAQTCQRHGLLPAGLDTATLCRHIAVRAGLLAAACAYRPKPLAIGPRLFAATDDEGHDLASAWRAVIGRHVEQVRVPGDHYSMVEEPHVALLASAVEGRLGDADDGGRSGTRQEHM